METIVENQDNEFNLDEAAEKGEFPELVPDMEKELNIEFLDEGDVEPANSLLDGIIQQESKIINEGILKKNGNGKREGKPGGKNIKMNIIITPKGSPEREYEETNLIITQKDIEEAEELANNIISQGEKKNGRRNRKRRRR